MWCYMCLKHISAQYILTVVLLLLETQSFSHNRALDSLMWSKAKLYDAGLCQVVF